MKSISIKLFIVYCFTIIGILVAIPSVSIYYYEYNQNLKNYEKIQRIYHNVSSYILETNDLKMIDKYVEMGTEFLIILKNNEIIFTNESEYKTSKILTSIEYNKKSVNKKNRRYQLESLYQNSIEKTELSGYVFYDKKEFLFKFNVLDINSDIIEFYIGIDEHILEDSLSDVYGENFYTYLFTINGFSFIVLMGFGYYLLRAAFYPAKSILEDIENLHSDTDLSLRISDNYANKEFSKLAENFNIMLENIEKDVDKIKALTITDPLTQLFNRRHFDNIFESEFRRCQRTKTNFIISIFDVDMFKQYNDYYGHKMGDEALIGIAETVKKCTNRNNDFAFRIGGEEFSIITSSMSSDEALRYFNDIRVAIEEQHIEHFHNKASDYLTASFGLYVIDFENDTYTYNGATVLEDIYKHTDELLYQAKENQRNNVVLDISSKQ